MTHVDPKGKFNKRVYAYTKSNGEIPMWIMTTRKSTANTYAAIHGWVFSHRVDGLILPVHVDVELP